MACERVLRALALAWCLAALVTPLAIVHAVPMQTSQAQFLQDCQTAWNQTYDGWNGSNPECQTATSIGCDEDGMIVYITLVYNQVEGSIPASISNLEELVHLDFSFAASLPTSSQAQSPLQSACLLT
ncbi:unnamed protein product [Closterium sp. Yama58-4]|nr:unnamed protein product [Closterium sp. Yama58-4]